MNIVFGGVLFIVLGFCIYFNPVMTVGNYGIEVDFTGIESYVSVFFVTFGTLLIWSEDRKK